MSKGSNERFQVERWLGFLRKQRIGQLVEFLVRHILRMRHWRLFCRHKDFGHLHCFRLGVKLRSDFKIAGINIFIDVGLVSDNVDHSTDHPVW